MSMRTTPQIFWWYLSYAMIAVDLVETISVVPVFPGEIAYFMVDNIAAPLETPEEEQERSNYNRVNEPGDASPRKKCSVIVLTIRTLTLLMAITFLLLHQRSYGHISSLHNHTVEKNVTRVL